MCISFYSHKAGMNIYIYTVEFCYMYHEHSKSKEKKFWELLVAHNNLLNCNSLFKLIKAKN